MDVLSDVDRAAKASMLYTKKMEYVGWRIFHDINILKGGAAQVSEVGAGVFSTQCWVCHFSQVLNIYHQW